MITPAAPNTGLIYLAVEGYAVIMHAVDDSQLDLLPGTLQAELETANFHVNKRFQENTVFVTLKHGFAQGYKAKLEQARQDIEAVYGTEYPAYTITQDNRDGYNIGDGG